MRAMAAVTRSLPCIICVTIAAAVVVKSADDCRLMDEGGSQAMVVARTTLDRLAPLRGRKFVSGPETLDSKTVTFSFSLCANPVPTGSSACRANSSVVVVDSDGNCTALGLYNETEIVGGDNWIMLTFSGGDNFTDPSCGSIERQSVVNIVCDSTRKQDVLEVLHVSAVMHKAHCFYSFVVSDSVVCASNHGAGDAKRTGLSGGSVLCIIFFTVVGVYLAFGFLYRRIVVRAKGVEQIPNYDFWREFGNLQADGCDFLCRCGGRQEAKMYQGIGGGALSGSGGHHDDDDRDSEDRDDRLLPM